MAKFKNPFVNLFVAIVVFSDICCGLQDVMLTISPSAAQRGGDVTLTCHYNLAGLKLYTIKWYRGRLEFYRFSPKDNPSQKIFAFQGINVDISRSNESQVVLTDVGYSIAGNMSCEVTTEAPSFLIANAVQELTVVDLPKTKPSITLNKKRYEPGDQLIANCTSSPSKPPVKLTFYINNTPVPIKYQVRDELTNASPLSRRSLVVNLTLITSHFNEQQNALLLNCTASIDKLYWDYTNLSIPYRKEPIPERGKWCVMRSLFKSWLTLEKELRKTCVKTSKFLNISIVKGDFKQLHYDCVSKILARRNDNTEEESEENCLQKNSKNDESPADHHLEFVVCEKMRKELEVYLETSLSKHISANIQYLSYKKGKPLEDSILKSTIDQVCKVYLNKISNACASVQVLQDDNQKLIPSTIFAVGHLPLQSYDEFMEFENKLQNEPEFRNSFTYYLRTLRMDTAKETIYRMIGASIAANVACIHSGQGKGSSNKLSFTDTQLCGIIILTSRNTATTTTIYTALPLSSILLVVVHKVIMVEY